MAISRDVGIFTVANKIQWRKTKSRII